MRSLLLALSVLLFMSGLGAATFTVANTGDAGTGSLRDAITQANGAAGADTITFDATFFATARTIQLATALPQITGDVTVTGPGSSLCTVRGLGATGTFRIFDIAVGTIGSISGLTLRDGRFAAVVGASADGGGLRNAGTLTVDSCSFIDCIARGGDAPGGPSFAGSGYGGGVANTGALTLTNVFFSECRAEGGSSPTFISGTGEGGAIHHSGAGATLVVTTCRIILCVAKGGSGAAAGFGLGGAMELLCPATLTEIHIDTCSVEPQASVGSSPGGIYFNASATGTTVLQRSTIQNCVGSAMHFGNSATNTYNITNCTITQNDNSSATSPGTIGCGANVDAFNSTINFTYCTIALNSGYEVGGVRRNNGAVTMRNCIVASNTHVLAGSSDVTGAFTDLGFNLIGDSTGSTGFTVSTLVGTGAAPIDPLLQALDFYGGYTPTLALDVGSPATDKGGASASVTTDQRSQPRINDLGAIANAAGGNGSDIGAFEQANGMLVTGAPLDFGTTFVSTPTLGQAIGVQGNGLTADIIVTPPTGFEVSLSSTTGYSNTALTLTQSGGSVAPTTVYIRFYPQTAGPFSANVTLASTGYTTLNAGVSGIAVDPPALTLSTSLSAFNTSATGTPSAEQSYTVSGVSLAGTVTLRITQPFEMSLTSGGPFSTAPIVLTPVSGTLAATTIYVRYNPTAGNLHAGLITHESSTLPTEFQTMVGYVGSLGSGSGGGSDESSCTTDQGSAAMAAIPMLLALATLVRRRKRMS